MINHIDKSLMARLKNDVDTITQPGIDSKTIAEIEAEFHIIFPPSYKTFLQECNGGQFGYARIFALNHQGDPNILDLKATYGTIHKFIKGTRKGEVFPFANDWGGSYFCFDMVHKDAEGEYPILYWNHEFAEDPEDEPHLWTKFADNFTQFLEKIIEE